VRKPGFEPGSKPIYKKFGKAPYFPKL